MEPGSIRQHISQALTDALGDDESDPESLYTFLIYMQLGIIKAAYPSIKKACVKAIDLTRYLNLMEETYNKAETNLIDYEDIKLLFDNDRYILHEIIEELWNTDTYSAELNWMSNWETNSRHFLESSDFNESFIYLSKLISEQIGLTDNIRFSKLMLNSFIQLSTRLSKTNRIIRIA